METPEDEILTKHLETLKKDRPEVYRVIEAVLKPAAAPTPPHDSARAKAINTAIECLAEFGTGTDCKEAREILKGMRNAPTPPAQEEFDSTKYTVKSCPVGDLGGKGVRVRLDEPAQEDEPDLYQIRMVEGRNKGNWVDSNRAQHDKLDGKGWEGRKLYTHPDDKLREAAGAVLARIDSLRESGIGILSLDAELEYLRAALECK